MSVKQPAFVGRDLGREPALERRDLRRGRALKGRAVAAAMLLVLAALALHTGGQAGGEDAHAPAGGDSCLACHGAQGLNPGIAQQWQHSAHGALGIGCADCHGLPAPGSMPDLANPRYLVETTWDQATGRKAVALVVSDGKPAERPDIWRHGGTEIVIAVSPRSCALCHERAAEEFHHSRHSSAAQFVGSLDNFLGRYAEGPAAAVSGCQQCHGSVVRVAEAGGTAPPRYAADTWPNTGMGRVNPDGSWGSCTACHSRHQFSAETARRPDNCGKCHMGPDHPQLEIFYESKHGIAYRKNERFLKLDQPAGQWVLGKDYWQAPTCATCHMGAVAPRAGEPGQEMTHDVGARISWTLRPKFSFQPQGITAPDGRVILQEPHGRREEMKRTCTTCHSRSWVDNFYLQYDQAVHLYNEKYARPADAIYQFLQQQGIIDDVPMNEKMDYVFYELWHHEGRRARHGAAMMGPDYVQWHGFYELTRNFYTEFLPLSLELAQHAGKGPQAEEFIRSALAGPDGANWERYHRWTEGLTEEQRNALLRWEQETYGVRK